MTAPATAPAGVSRVAAAPAGRRAARARWCWGTRLVMVTACGWLVFTVAHLLLSGRFWLWALADLVPPGAFVVVPLGLLLVARLARPARWRVVLLAGAALAIGVDAAGVRPDALWHREPPAGSDAVRVVSWNTEFWHDGDDPDAFYRHLRAQDADVYLLQEYVTLVDHDPVEINDLDRLRAEFPDYQVIAYSELVTLSRLPVVAWRPVDASDWLSAAEHSLPPPNAAFPPYWTTKTLRTDIQVGRRTVSFYNSHLPVPLSVTRSPLGSDFYRIIREQHGRRWANVRALVADLDANRNPVVLAGDLNASPAMSLLRPITDRLVDAGAALRSVYPTSWGIAGVSLWRLDWVFTTPEVRVHRYRFVDSAGLSDHPIQQLAISVP